MVILLGRRLEESVEENEEFCLHKKERSESPELEQLLLLLTVGSVLIVPMG